jgi:CubicO group peptidase (beta-lactamase class C family)
MLRCARRGSALLLLFAMATVAAMAQAPASITGDYNGTLGPLHLKLHLKSGTDGLLSGTLDSGEQGLIGIPCTELRLNGSAFSFKVPSVNGSWTGTVSKDGGLLEGTWSQGSPLALKFTRDTFVPAAKPSAFDGAWLGTLNAGGTSLRIQLNVKSDASGHEYCTLDSLDQRAMGLECGKVEVNKDELSFAVPSVNGTWNGKLLADGKRLRGTWNQGAPLPLEFERQAAAISLTPIAYDPAQPPVTAAELPAVLGRDLAKAIESGELAPATGTGLVIGVVDHGAKQVFAYGTAKPDSIFEIGSISKTFTGLLLAQMVQQQKVKFDEPVRELLPAGTVARPAGAEITLLDLATQHSGLPRMPDNFHPADNQNPYADYRPADLYAFMAKQGVAKPSAPPFLYSNLGVGLLGQALAVRAGTSYADLLQTQITGPLGMNDTVIKLSPAQQLRFIPGHDGNHRPAHAWDLDALAGAGAIRSTANDMLIYLDANLHPEKLPPTAGKTLQAAITRSHELRADAGSALRIALAWLYKADTDTYWHNGGTGGYSAFTFFSPSKDCAVIVLVNSSPDATGSFADRVGQHIMERLMGKPAISLAN